MYMYICLKNQETSCLAVMLWNECSELEALTSYDEASSEQNLNRSSFKKHHLAKTDFRFQTEKALAHPKELAKQ